MDQNLRYLLDQIDKRISRHERYIVERLREHKDELSEEIKLLKVENSELKSFKYKVLGGSGVIAFLVTTALMVLFN